MPKTAHTPGPWESRGPTENGSVVVAQVKSYLHLCTCYRMDGNGPERAEANAALIAAAPELLEALKGILPAFDNESTRTIRKVYADRIEAAEAAIAKAEKGE